MLKHLDLWITAQKHWVTLDPVYNSGMFENFFGENNYDLLYLKYSDMILFSKDLVKEVIHEISRVYLLSLFNFLDNR